MKVYWGIADGKGRLALNYGLDVPFLSSTEQGAKEACVRKGERPVRVEVRIVEEGE